MMEMNQTPGVIVEMLEKTLLRLQNAFRNQPYPDLKQRIAWLDKLEKLTVRHSDDICRNQSGFRSSLSS
jgi:hypothetical protein